MTNSDEEVPTFFSVIWSSFSKEDKQGLVNELVEEENEKGEVKEYCVAAEEEEQCSWSVEEVEEFEAKNSRWTNKSTKAPTIYPWFFLELTLK